jgi:hypothetical protein
MSGTTSRGQPEQLGQFGPRLTVDAQGGPVDYLGVAGERRVAARAGLLAQLGVQHRAAGGQDWTRGGRSAAITES